MLTNTAAAAARVTKLLALAASTYALGNYGEHDAAVLAAYIHAERAGIVGLEFWRLCDAVGANATAIVPWTNEKVPAGPFAPCKRIVLADGSTIVPWTNEAGIMVEWYASEAQEEILLGRGFWRDCDVQEAVWLACDAWGVG